MSLRNINLLSSLLAKTLWHGFVQAAMLCDTCQNIDFVDGSDFWDVPRHYHYISHVQNTANLAFAPIRKDDLDHRYYLHQPSFQDLARSKEAGCYFCAAMWYAFKEPPSYWKAAPLDTKSANSKTLPIVLRLWINPRPEYTSIWRDIPVGEWVRAFCGTYSIEMRRAPVPTNPFSRFSHELERLGSGGRLHGVDEDTGSALCISLAQAWYRRCVRNHKACAISNPQTGSVPNLPRRVIDVKDEGANPVLYEPAEGEQGEYVALSHCWGDTKPIPVERGLLGVQAAIGQGRQQFSLPPFAEWPKTFRDAVAVVRKFKLRYLWIDNTGIVQGNQDDWARESGRMAQYFGNATLTIAASWGDNDDQGLFHRRNPLLVRPLRLIASSKDPPYAGFYISVDGPMPLNSLSENTPLTPLYSRAWVLQEEQLSRRILRFGEKSISWSCFTTSSASENKYTGWNVRPYKRNVFQDRPPMRIHLRLPDYDGIGRQQGRNPYFRTWYEIVQAFTGRNMKFKNDVLPAISGLAQTFVPFMDKDDKYLAGLWRNDLKLGLLWTAGKFGSGRRLLPPEITNFDPSGFTGPSWSWISHCHKCISLYFHDHILPGGVYNYLGLDSFVGTEIIEVRIQYRSLDEPYGQVAGGRLRVRARLPNLRIRAEPYELTREERDKSEYITGGLSRSHIRRLITDKTPFPETRENMVGTCEVDDVDDRLWRAHLRNGIVEATFLPLIMHYVDSSLPTQLAGLALLPVGGYENEFVRIGRASVDVDSVWAVKDCTLPFREIVIV